MNTLHFRFDSTQKTNSLTSAPYTTSTAPWSWPTRTRTMPFRPATLYERPLTKIELFKVPHWHTAPTLVHTKLNSNSIAVALLPNIIPQLIPSGVQPLLIFVNVKSGGCQGLELVTSFRKLLNPYQVYDLDIGGPLPGLYVFRHVKDYRILVCGGDGTIGWVLQCLDNVGQDSECSSPPCAIVPLGTGNDLARVLRWGPGKRSANWIKSTSGTDANWRPSTWSTSVIAGYTGGEDPLNLLRDVIDAEEIRLDRWTVVFHPEEKASEDKSGGMANSTAISNEDNTQIFVMNNYFGIGIDADLCLDFHNAREENPNKFNSRYANSPASTEQLNTT
jgi:diacylglycerol kinase (ATP)